MIGRRLNWAEYGLEAFGLGLFMVSACGFGVLLFHPDSPAVAAIPGDGWRRALMGLAMAGTNVLNIYAPWGRRSGAHLNPATTLTFYRLGKVAPVDFAGYVAGQFAGGILGTAAAAALFGARLGDPAVNYVTTVPGPLGAGPAFIAEVVITLVLMTVVLAMVAQRSGVARYTGVAASALVFLYITFESPISGMSMNPARTTGSAALAGLWSSAWIYFLAPPLGMLAAAEVRRRTSDREHCAKYHHDESYRCIFCEWVQATASRRSNRSGS